MRTESRIFNLVAGVLYVFAGTYAWWTDKVSTIDWAGTLALILSGTMCAMLGLYFGFVARRIEPRPEDRPDAEIADGAGEMGFFSPGSYWPVGIAVSCAVAGLGLVFQMWWLLAAGLVAVLVTTCGLVFEYYTGTRRTLD